MGHHEVAAVDRTLIQPSEGQRVDFGALGVIWKIEGSESDGRFSVVEHPIPSRSLASPLHYHRNEDEFSFVLEGTMGAMLGEKVILASQGSWVFKPRGQWHAFWNADIRPCRILEVISPAGFENYFREVSVVFDEGENGRPDLDRFAEVNARYDLEMDFDSIGDLCDRFGLTHPLR
jgi:mannose-6-phosphate isomerase-like protein (cupin superfamily)